jgi:hypothetical protein
MNVSRKLFLATGLLVSSISWGQHRVVANIPFDFTTPSGRLPAGHYEIVAGVGGSANVVKWRHEESKKSVLMLSGGPVYNLNTSSANPAQLVFHCGDSGCSLCEIWPGNGGDGWWFIQPRKRSELKTQVATVSVPATAPNKAPASAKPSGAVEQNASR